MMIEHLVVTGTVHRSLNSWTGTKTMAATNAAVRILTALTGCIIHLFIHSFSLFFHATPAMSVSPPPDGCQVVCVCLSLQAVYFFGMT